MEEITIEQLAAFVGYSKYYLSRKFSKELGVSANQYIMKIRMEKAKGMLVVADTSIQDISECLILCNEI